MSKISRTAIRALIKTVTEARTMHCGGQLGAPLRRLLSHACTLVDAFDEKLATGARNDGDSESRRLIVHLRRTLRAIVASLPSSAPVDVDPG